VSSAERYVLAAYVVVLAAVLAYVLIISLKVSRLERELGELARRAQERRAEEPEREEAAVG
jgi:CcmD family protein